VLPKSGFSTVLYPKSTDKPCVCVCESVCVQPVCVRACMRACIRAYMRACLRACVHACVCACVCVRAHVCMCVPLILNERVFYRIELIEPCLTTCVRVCALLGSYK
jgi:hypothetical protein